MTLSARRDGDGIEAELRVDRLWDGTPLADGAVATLRLLDRPGRGVEVLVDAARHGDPLPAAPPGRLDGLWQYEVVELFLLGEDARYLELEVGPGGHHLALAFAGERVRADDDVPVRVEFTSNSTAPGAARWSARIELAERELPRGWREAGRRCNAYTIHGAPGARRYAVAHVLGTAQPDFHAIDAFPSLIPR